MLADGKLITLTVNKAASSAHENQYPLDRLPFYFPVPPVGDLKHSISASHSESGVIRRGQISQFGGPDLDEISWESEFLVSDWFTDSAGNTHGPSMPSYVIAPPAGFRFFGAQAAIALLKDIAHGGYVLDLTVQDRNTGRIEIHQPVTLRSLQPIDRGGEPDTRFYSITFKQYRFLTIRTVPRGGVVENTGKPRPDAGGRYIASPYIIKRAEAKIHVAMGAKDYYCMGIQRLALKAYHDKSKWPLIVSANGGSKGMRKKGCFFEPKSPDGSWLIPSGTKLVIPTLRPTNSGGIGTVPAGTPPPVPAGR